MNLRSIPIKGVWKIFLPSGILALGFAALMFSCSSDSTTTPTEPRAWFYESEFAGDPGLVARAGQVVILDILPGEELAEHTIPYQYEEGGGYLFAIEWDDPFITRAEIFDRSGVLVATTERGDGGVYLDMVPGSYSMKVYHDGTDVPEEGSVAFIRRQKVETAQSAAEGETLNEITETSLNLPEYPAYGALQIVGGDYDGQYLIIDSVSCAEWTYYPLGSVSIDTKEGPIKDRRHLFSFKSDSTGGCPDPPPSFVGSYDLYPFTYSEPSRPLVISGIEDCPSCPSFCPSSQKKTSVYGEIILPGFSKYGTVPVSSCVQDVGDGSLHLWSYYPDPIALSSPLYVAENGYMYWTQYSYGKDPDSLKMVEGFTYYKDGSQIKKEDLKKGEVALYEGENYTGVAVVLSASFSETTLIALDQIKSLAFGIYTDTTIQFFGESDFTDLVRTVGVDMPVNLGINGSDIGSIKIFDSKKVFISSKKCPYCNLGGVDLSDLNLDGADLSYANLTAARLQHSSLKTANLSRALLYGAFLNNANLSGAKLEYAALNANSKKNIAAATLTGAYLKKANLKGADLGGADFTSASLHYAKCNGANMASTNFSSAYLVKTDFSETTAPGADFTDAILTGAIFTGASLKWSASSGKRTDFIRAFVGGTDLAAKHTEGANFQSTYVNFSRNLHDYSIFFTIPTDNTNFPGFDDQYGKTPCVWVAYSQATAAPSTDSTNICPDANTYEHGCTDTAWTSPVTPMDQSEWKNSPGETQPSWCENVDYNW